METDHMATLHPEQCHRCGIGMDRDAIYCEVCETGLGLTNPRPDTSTRMQQVGGTHYTDMAIQPWDALRVWLRQGPPMDPFCAHLRATAIKYLARYPQKGGIEDVKKARHCLDTLIAEMESEATK